MKALVVIDIQNDITKHYKDIIDNLNKMIDWAKDKGLIIAYFKHLNLSPGTRTFKPNTKGSELVGDLNIVSNNIFTKFKGNILTNIDFVKFVKENQINEFYITGADATACIKASSYNLAKEGYITHVVSDCITSYDLKKIDEMLQYYASKGCLIEKMEDIMF